MSPITIFGLGEAEENYELVSVEAMLAGTLALMTGFAQARPDCPNRPAMAAKLVANLRELAGHPALSATMHKVLQGLVGHWQREQARLCGAALDHAAGTHRASARLH
jgi:hypothetical protein